MQNILVNIRIRIPQLRSISNFTANTFPNYELYICVYYEHAPFRIAIILSLQFQVVLINAYIKCQVNICLKIMDFYLLRCHGPRSTLILDLNLQTSPKMYIIKIPLFSLSFGDLQIVDG